MKTIRIKYFPILLIIWMISSKVHAQQKDSLNYYLEIAVQNNPGLKADFTAFQAALQRVPQAGTIPDPQLEMGFFLPPMDIIDGSQLANITVMQMFPWFGTRKAAQNEANYMANMAFEKFRETRDNLYLNIYTQWFILCRLQQQLQNNLENRDFLEQLEKLSIRKFSSPTGSSGGYPVPSPVQPSTTTASSGMGMGSMAGMGASPAQPTAQSSNMPSMGSSGTAMSGMTGRNTGMSEVLRIQLEIAEVNNNIESLQSEIKAEKARFNALLNQPSENVVNIPNSIDKIDFRLDIPSTLKQISDNNPMLNMLAQEELVFQAKAEMDRKMSLPMLGVGLQYSLTKKRMDMGIPVTEMNGMDMLMPMVSVSLPIYRNKYRAQQKESELLQQAAKERHTDTYNALQSELLSIRHLLDDAERQINLLNKQVELALTTYNLVVQEFATGKSNLADVIQVQRQLLDYKLRDAEAVANYNTKVANVQRLISFNINNQNR